MSKVCLVLEGGGNRGTYTSGVLDAFIDNDIVINNIYGVSAGALNAMSYFSKQRGRSFRINKEYIFSKKCISYKRAIRGNILNLDYLFNEVNLKDDPLDFATFNKYNENYVTVSTNVVTGAPYYKNIRNYEQDWEYIKASASLPLFSKIVKVDNLKLLDGGASDSIPVVKALEDGYDKVIVVLTRDREFVASPYGLMHAYKAKYFMYPNLIKALENRYNKYNVTRDLIASLEQENKIIAIYPSKPIVIKNLEKDADKLKSIYELGYQDAMLMMEKIKNYIGGTKDEKKYKKN